MQTLQEVIRLSRVQEDKRDFGVELVRILDKEGNVLYISPMHKLILGYDPCELENNSIFNIVYPHDVDRIVRSYKDMVQNSHQNCAPTAFEYRFLRKDNSIIEMRSEAVPLIENDLLSGYLVVSNTRRTINVHKLSRAFFKSVAG